MRFDYPSIVSVPWVAPMALLALSFPAGGESPGGAAPAFRVSIERMVELECFDCDGVALGDISGNGKVDILASTGDDGETLWFEQGATPWEWTRHVVHQIADTPREIEGNDLADFDGDGRLEAVSLDQPNGNLYLLKQNADPREPWHSAVIQGDRPYIQATLVTDLTGDGRPDLVYTWEGDAEGRGGVHWLQFTGDDPLDPAHWTDRVLVTHESAWWLAPRRLDMNGNGRATDIVYTARNIPRRNPGARPGLYWLEEPADPAQPWTRHVIDPTLRHPLHVDVGDLNGDGVAMDLVVGGFDTDAVYWYEHAAGWARHRLPLPAEVNGNAPNRVWNVKAVPLGSRRDGILAPVTGGERRGALLHFEHVDGAFHANNLLDLDYDHPIDDRILLHDLDGDGQLEAIMPDSGPAQDRLLIVKFRVEPAE